MIEIDSRRWKSRQRACVCWQKVVQMDYGLATGPPNLFIHMKRKKGLNESLPRLLFPLCVALSNPYFTQTVSMEPIRAGGMREGEPYLGDNFEVTNCGCLEEAGLYPFKPVQFGRSSGTNDRSKTCSNEGRSCLEVLFDSVCCIPSRL